jgi:hypothetical protein
MLRRVLRDGKNSVERGSNFGQRQSFAQPRGEMFGRGTSGPSRSTSIVGFGALSPLQVTNRPYPNPSCSGSASTDVRGDGRVGFPGCGSWEIAGGR